MMASLLGTLLFGTGGDESGDAGDFSHDECDDDN